MTSRRIGFDARFINNRYHGIGRYAFHLLEALTRLSPDLTFAVFRGRDRDDRFDWHSLAQRKNVEIWKAPRLYFSLHEPLLWQGILQRSQVELFHSPYFPAPLLSRLPVLITVHDLIFERYPEYMPWRRALLYYRMLMRLSVRKARKVITVSQATARDLHTYYPASGGKIAVIPEGVSPAFAPWVDHSRLEGVRGKYHLELPFILSVGAHRPHKNLERLIQAFHLIHSDFPHRLVLVGSKDRRFHDQAQQTAAALGLDGRVQLVEWVDEADLPGIYSLAEGCILPSLIEGFGLPVLEAMACGTPVIASDRSALCEVAGEAGVLVDPGDVSGIAAGIRRVLSDAGLRQTLSEAGLRRAAGFTWENSAVQLKQVYEACLG